MYAKKVHGLTATSTSPDCRDSADSFVLVPHSFGVLQSSAFAKGHETTPSPNGVDTQELERVLQQDRELLSALPPDEVERLLDEKHAAVSNALESFHDQASISGQSASSECGSFMDVEHVLDELKGMSAAADVLSVANFGTVTAAVSTPGALYPCLGRSGPPSRPTGPPSKSRTSSRSPRVQSRAAACVRRGAVGRETCPRGAGCCGCWILRPPEAA